VHDDVFEVLSRHITSHVSDSSNHQEELERYLRVTMYEADYAIPVEYVRRITEFFPMENISNAQGNIRGAINMNGNIIPVLDMERALNLQSFFDQNEYVIVGNNQQEWAICVDAAHGLVDVPASKVQRMHQQGSNSFVNGVVRIDEQLIPLLDFSIMETSR
jgi:purine-binding chemotaxis protein CheW